MNATNEELNPVHIARWLAVTRSYLGVDLRSHAVRTTYGMEARALERVELRAPAGRKAKWNRAAERAGVSLSDWARRRLDELADALAVEGALKGSGLGARVRAARKTPWTVE